MINVRVLKSNVNQVRLFRVHHGAMSDSDKVILIPEVPENLLEGMCYLLTDSTMEYSEKVEVIVVADIPILDDGDIVQYNPTQRVLYVLFSVRSAQSNVLFLTTRCNSLCMMCPQPPTPDDGEYYPTAEELVDLVTVAPKVINITGGEPTLDKNSFLQLISLLGVKWPTSDVVLLSNGKTFADSKYVEELFLRISPDKITIAIPLYADSAFLHDKIVGVEGSWAETIKGLYNLARCHARIEIRFVLMKNNINRISGLLRFLGMNLPFVNSISIMGMEPMGLARSHWSELWIDPLDCVTKLEEAAKVAARNKIQLMLYNFQYCCLPRRLWAYVCPSISDWKRLYLPVCQSCQMKANCGGLFESQNKPQYRSRYFS